MNFKIDNPVLADKIIEAIINAPNFYVQPAQISTSLNESLGEVISAMKHMYGMNSTWFSDLPPYSDPPFNL